MYYLLYGWLPAHKPSDHAIRIISFIVLVLALLLGILLIVRGVVLEWR